MSSKKITHSEGRIGWSCTSFGCKSRLTGRPHCPRRFCWKPRLRLRSRAIWWQEWRFWDICPSMVWYGFHLTSSYPQIVASQIFISYILASASHLCIFISRIFTSSLSSSGLHILKPLLWSRNHTVLCYHLQDFITLCLQLDIYIFTSSKR